MEMCVDSNIQKLYEKMKKNGYDTTPRNITNIYPSGFSSSENNESEKI